MRRVRFISASIKFFVGAVGGYCLSWKDIWMHQLLQRVSHSWGLGARGRSLNVPVHWPEWTGGTRDFIHRNRLINFFIIILISIVNEYKFIFRNKILFRNIKSTYLSPYGQNAQWRLYQLQLFWCNTLPPQGEVRLKTRHWVLESSFPPNGGSVGSSSSL